MLLFTLICGFGDYFSEGFGLLGLRQWQEEKKNIEKESGYFIFEGTIRFTLEEQAHTTVCWSL